MTYNLHYNTVQLQQLVRLQNEVESSGFFSKCAEHVIWRRTVLAVALQQQKRLYSILRHGRTDRRQRSLQLGEDALRLARRYRQRSHDGQQSVDVWKLDAAATAECCRSSVRALFCCSRCPLLTPQNILCLDDWQRVVEQRRILLCCLLHLGLQHTKTSILDSVVQHNVCRASQPHWQCRSN